MMFQNKFADTRPCELVKIYPPLHERGKLTLCDEADSFKNLWTEHSAAHCNTPTLDRVGFFLLRDYQHMLKMF